MNWSLFDSCKIWHMFKDLIYTHILISQYIYRVLCVSVCHVYSSSTISYTTIKGEEVMSCHLLRFSFCCGRETNSQITSQAILSKHLLGSLIVSLSPAKTARLIAAKSMVKVKEVSYLCQQTLKQAPQLNQLLSFVLAPSWLLILPTIKQMLINKSFIN